MAEYYIHRQITLATKLLKGTAKHLYMVMQIPEDAKKKLREVEGRRRRFFLYRILLNHHSY